MQRTVGRTTSDPQGRVGRAILAHIAGKVEMPPAGFPFSRYKGTDEVSWEARTRAVMGLDVGPVVATKAKPKTKPSRKPKKEPEYRQMALFAAEAA